MDCLGLGLVLIFACTDTEDKVVDGLLTPPGRPEPQDHPRCLSHIHLLSSLPHGARPQIWTYYKGQDIRSM